MAIKKEKLDVDSATARCRPIEFITGNGFSIVRTGETEAMRPAPEGGFAFMVRDPDGTERETTVRIDQQAVNEITLRSRGRIASQSSYWICCAERHLAEYLWENDNCPTGEEFSVDQLTPEDLNLAIRWGTT